MRAVSPPGRRMIARCDVLHRKPLVPGCAMRGLRCSASQARRPAGTPLGHAHAPQCQPQKKRAAPSSSEEGRLRSERPL